MNPISDLETRLIKMICTVRFHMEKYDFKGSNPVSWDALIYSHEWVCNILESQGFDIVQMHQGKFIKNGVKIGYEKFGGFRLGGDF